MHPLDSKLEEYQRQVGQWIDQQRGFESRARECHQTAELLRARIAGIREAMTLMAEAERSPVIVNGVFVEEKPVSPVRRRQRSLTGHWQQIMQLVDSENGFSYDDLAEAVVAVGHDANRDTLRSQMSLYKGGGLVEPVGNGLFRLTDVGRRAAGMDTESEAKPSNENGPVSAGSDDRDEEASDLLAPES